MRWWRKPPDLSLSNEYQDLTRGGCINCGALIEVLKSQNMYNSSALHDILSKMPASSGEMEGCWAYLDRPDYYPTCLGKPSTRSVPIPTHKDSPSTFSSYWIAPSTGSDS